MAASGQEAGAEALGGGRLYVYVDDVDAHHARVQANGVDSSEPRNEPWGDRAYSTHDPHEHPPVARQTRTATGSVDRHSQDHSSHESEGVVAEYRFVGHGCDGTAELSAVDCNREG
jgi:hypothetical protein